MYTIQFPGKETEDQVFTTLSAIFRVYNKKQIGCQVEHLWNSKIRPDKPFQNKYCTIKQVEKVKASRK